MAKFDHPNIVRVLSVFEANDTAYLVMRFEQGQTLGALLKARGRLPEAELRTHLEATLDGLEVIHREGFIHRDLKPTNVYIRDDGRALLIDFGSARQALSEHTQTLTAVVSPGYAPFEQYHSDGARQGPWTDIYALAATAYRAVTGTAPLAAVDRGRGILEGQGDPLPPCRELAGEHYSAALLEAIDWGLRFKIEERPADVARWRAALFRQTDFEPPPSTPAAAPTDDDAETVVASELPTSPASKKRWYSRKRVWVVVVALLLILSDEDEDETVDNPAHGNVRPGLANSAESAAPAETALQPPSDTQPTPDSTAVAAVKAAATAPAAALAATTEVVEHVGARLRAALGQRDYAAAEAVLAEAAAAGVDAADLRRGEDAIAAGRTLAALEARIQANPRWAGNKKIQTAMDRAGKALRAGRPTIARKWLERLQAVTAER